VIEIVADVDLAGKEDIATDLASGILVISLSTSLTLPKFLESSSGSYLTNCTGRISSISITTSEE
jgi:hypothetical protein